MITKRNLLKAFPAAVALPMMLRAAKAKSGNDTLPPLRIVTVVDAYGISQNNRSTTWISSQMNDYQLESGHLGTILEPLGGHEDRLLVVSGIPCSSADEMNSSTVHEPMARHCLTGSSGFGPNENSRQKHASIDVAVGQFLHSEYELAQQRPYAHLYFSDYGEASKPSPCFDVNGYNIRSIRGVKNIVDGIFGVDDGPVAKDLRVRSQLAVVESVAARVAAMRPHLRQSNASQVMDAYAAAVSDVDSALELSAALDCTVPQIPPGFSQDVSNMESTELIFECIAAALKCDLASSITYSIGGECINQMRYQSVYQAVGFEHPGLTNKNHHAASHDTTEVGDEAMAIVRRWQMQQVANLVEHLSQVDDVSHGKVMDNTLIYLPSVLSHNQHQRENYATLLIAGSNTRFRGGRHYDCSGSTNNDLLTTIAHGMGMFVDSFGGFKGDTNGPPIAGLNNGPISKLLTT